MSNLIVLNGKFYAGTDPENKLILKDNRTEALPIDGDELKIVMGAIFCRVMADEIKLKRLEVLRS